MRTSKNKMPQPERAALLPNAENNQIVGYGAAATTDMTVTLDDLPPELLDQIFRLLLFPDFMRIRSTCKYFWEICNGNSVLLLHHEEMLQIAKKKSVLSFLPWNIRSRTGQPATRGKTKIASIFHELVKIKESETLYSHFDPNIGFFPNLLLRNGTACNGNEGWAAVGTIAFVGSVVGLFTLLFSRSSRGQSVGGYFLAMGVGLYLMTIAWAALKCCNSNSNRSSDEDSAPPRPKHDALKTAILGPYYCLKHMHNYSRYKRQQGREVARHELIRALELEDRPPEATLGA